jgi:uncharacterized membrane protein YhaH (DUF805 family)
LTDTPSTTAPAMSPTSATGGVPLWAPLYGASFGQAFVRFWRKYSDFEGRASRSEFWWAYLAQVLLIAGLYALPFAVSAGISNIQERGAVNLGLFGVALLVELALVIPRIAVAIRRLHDAGYSGTHFLVCFIPIAGPIIFIVFCATQSNPEGAKYDRPQ